MKKRKRKKKEKEKAKEEKEFLYLNREHLMRGLERDRAVTVYGQILRFNR